MHKWNADWTHFTMPLTPLWTKMQFQFCMVMVSPFVGQFDCFFTLHIAVVLNLKWISIFNLLPGSISGQTLPNKYVWWLTYFNQCMHTTFCEMYCVSLDLWTATQLCCKQIYDQKTKNMTTAKTCKKNDQKLDTGTMRVTATRNKIQLWVMNHPLQCRVFICGMMVVSLERVWHATASLKPWSVDHVAALFRGLVGIGRWSTPVAHLLVVVVAAHSSSCSPGTHLHRQINWQTPINKPNVIASPPCQLQVAQTSKLKGTEADIKQKTKQKANPKSIPASIPA